MCSNNYEVNRICRICLNTSINLTDIFSSTSTISSINTAIMECAPVLISETDTLPHTICTCCLEKLETAYNFRTLCIQSDQTLRNNISNTIVKDEKDEKLTISSITELSSVWDNSTIKYEKEENLSPKFPSDSSSISSDNDNRVEVTSPKIPNTKIRSKNQLQTKLKVSKSKSGKCILKPEVDGFFHCNQCTKKYKHKKDLKRHSIVHTNFGTRSKKCPLKQKDNDQKIIELPSFLDNSTIIKHEKEENLEDNNGTLLENNKKKLNIKKQSKNRVQSKLKLPKFELKKCSVKAEADGYFHCDQCTKKYKNKKDLKRHSVLHTNFRFHCDQCDKIFYTNQNLRRHMDVHNPEQKYNCEFCGSMFRSSSLLRNHQRTHSTLRQFKCEICAKEFKFRTTLIKHAVIHKGERPFVCGECGRSFKRKDHLTVHDQIHTGKRFKCVYCGQAFITKQSMNNHLLKSCSQLS